MSTETNMEQRLGGTVPQADSCPNMALIPGGMFRMGSDRHYPEEAPVHRVTVTPFRIDFTPVTNAQFRYAAGHAHGPGKPCCAPHNPHGVSEAQSYDPG